MKSIVAGAVAALVIGLAIATPFIVILLILIAPLVVLGLASGWGVVHGGSGAVRRRREVIRGRHVVTPGHQR
jgi:hypothetical protein